MSEKEEDFNNLSEHLQEAANNVLGLIKEMERHDSAESAAVLAVASIASVSSDSLVGAAGILESAKHWLLSKLSND